jgi:hypothetical protein
MEVLVTLILVTLIIGVVFFYPLFFKNRPNAQKVLSPVTYNERLFGGQLLSTFKLLSVLVILLLITSLVGNVSGFDASKDVYLIMILTMASIMVFI